MKGRQIAGMLKNWRPTRLTEKGYTITEVMIVLAVSGALFAAVAFTLAGRQNDAQYTQSVRNYETLIQNVISEVSNGYYQNDDRCSASISGGEPTFPIGAANPGANIGCVFAGKIIVPDGTNTEVLTIIGRQFAPYLASDEGKVPSNTIEESDPVAAPDPDKQLTNSFGLRVLKIFTLDSSNTELSAFGYMVPTAGGASSGPKGSVSGVRLYGVQGTVGSGVSSVRLKISDLTEFQPVNEGVILCLEGAGGTREKAEMRISANSSQSSITSELKTPATGLCA